jgi:hypothetical protein
MGMKQGRWVWFVLLAGIVGMGTVMRSGSLPLKRDRLPALALSWPDAAWAQVPSGASTVTVGNVTLPIPWEQRGDRIGIADLLVMQHLGVELQNSTDPRQQPVLWFADEGQFVPVWFNQGYRFLDLTDWAAQRGWQLVPSGNNLRIQAPTGIVTAGRRSQQPGSDRIVLEVDRPVLWGMIEEPTGFRVRVQANPGHGFNRTALTGGNGAVLTGLEVAAGAGQVEVRGTFDETARPRVWSLSNPNRIVIDVSQRDVVPRDIAWAPGVRWRQQYVTVGDRPFPVHQIWLDLDTATSLRPIWPDRAQLPGTAPLVTTARTWGTYAAINAGFFNRNNQLPLGTIRSNNQWVSGPILNRGSLAWDNQRRFLLSPVTLTHTLTSLQGARFPVTHINSGYIQAGIGLYTPLWGSAYTPVGDMETLVIVNQNQVIQQVRTGAAGTGTFPIPPQGYLLAFRSYDSAAQAFPPGTTVALTPDLRPPEFGELPFAIGGGPVLVRSGSIVANAKAEGFSDAFATQAAPRSAIGFTPDGKLALVAVHFSPGDRGPTLQETAQIMLQLGLTNALNLDGGTSTSLYLGGTLVNRHPGTVGRVHNGLGVFLAPPGN